MARNRSRFDLTSRQRVLPNMAGRYRVQGQACGWLGKHDTAAAAIIKAEQHVQVCAECDVVAVYDKVGRSQPFMVYLTSKQGQLPATTGGIMATKKKTAAKAAAKTKIKKGPATSDLQRTYAKAKGKSKPKAKTKTSAPAPQKKAASVRKRDPRIPAVGQTIKKVYKGATLTVKVVTDGFEYRGRTHRSLSALAKHITGSTWNGLLFFGLIKRSGDKKAAK